MAAEEPSSKSSESEEPARDMINVVDWLVLGPIAAPLPAYNDEGESKVGAEELLGYRHLPLEKLKPRAGSKVSLIGGGEASWKSARTEGGGVAIEADTTMPWVAYLAAYVEVPRWMKIDLEAGHTHAFELTVDGSSAIKESGGAKMEDDPKKGTAKLEKGKHLLLVKTVYAPADTIAEWRFDLKLSANEEFEPEPVLSTDPSREMKVSDVLDAPTIQRVAISPDGVLYAVWITERTPPEGDSESRMEVRRVRDGELIRTFKDMEGTSRWSWTPAGDRLSYVTTSDGKSALRVMDLEEEGVETVLEDVENFDGYAWSPDGSYIAYSVQHEYEPDDSGLKRLRGPYDRRHYERDKSFLHLASVPRGITRELTTGEHTTYIYDIHPDAEKILIGRYYEDLSGRPYAITEISLLDVKDQTIEGIHKGPWIRGALWSPDGDKILVLGGPSAFGDVGVNVPEGATPNEYDTQAYILDPDTKDVDPITLDFDPTIESAFWPKRGDYIYFVAEETEYGELYRYDVRRRSFTKIDLPCDVIHSADVARDRPVAMCRGSSANEHLRLYSVDLTGGRSRMALDPALEWFEDVKIGAVDDWNFTASTGVEIVGRVHYPPDFDPDKKYPCIVYYYGGTSPVARSFGGRYPKNLWASHGYVVYVLQPSGATGFGQEFSAVHVNDWGETTTGEIIEGLQEFLKAHPFVDPKRVGCIGASYGGFMTQLLITRTDMFAAAISHAGISALTSYWGEGYWGYLYSAAATANSFPWNRPDIYVKHSPIYSADKINTPLLLLHGDSDTNVPPGESEQMYTALKLLGKEVEYIRVLGEDHWVLDYKKRIGWSNAIVSWFDKWLKDEPEWWNDMYPPLDGEEEGEEREAESKVKRGEGMTEGAKMEPETAKTLKIELPFELGVRAVELEEYGTVLFGEVTREDIERLLPDWNAEYFDYATDEGLKADLGRYLKDVEITAVIGTWCPDCRREIPRLWKILEETEYPVSKMKMYAVGSSRFTSEMGIPPDVLNWSATTRKFFGAEAVATIIFTRSGVELGRIVESPETTLEEDMLKIAQR